ncbi:MAG: murein biosynthesis integral membrane protein MurJ [Gammaproteobacteria bacterium]|jgi:putative peptidoglycan lipid II flippase
MTSAVARSARRVRDWRAAGARSADGARGGEFRSALLITGLQLSGKLLGLAKTLVIAALFGASGAFDAFLVAYTIPTLLPGLVLGVVATAFIPRFMYSAAGGVDRIDWRGLNTLFTIVAAAILLLALSVMLGRSAIVTVLAPGLPAPVHDLAARLTGIMSIAIVFFGLNALLSALLQAFHRFGVISLESVISNVVIITGCVALAGRHGIDTLAVAVIAGFALHSVILIWVNRDLLAHHIRPALALSHADFRKPLAHMLPLLVGYLGATATTVVDRMFVSTLDSGAISVLGYASMIALLPMEVFGQAVMTVFYPSLSRDHANGDGDGSRRTHARGLRMLLFVLVPATAALTLTAAPLISLLFERGKFTPEAATLTAAAMAALAWGLPGRAINYFNFRVFHARREPWTAVGIGLLGVGLNALFDYLLIGPFGVTGIAAATTLSLSLCAVLSTWLVEHRTGGGLTTMLARPVVKLTAMTAVLIVVTMVGEGLLDKYLVGLPAWQSAGLNVICVMPGLIAFLGMGHLLKLEEVHTLFRIIPFVRNRSGTPPGTQA